jgi:hypothetical protein
MLGFYSDLGDVGIANVNWKYDHDLNLLKLTKTCILLCSDTLFVDRLEISSAHECKKRKKLVVKQDEVPDNEEQEEEEEDEVSKEKNDADKEDPNMVVEETTAASKEVKSNGVRKARGLFLSE